MSEFTAEGGHGAVPTTGVDTGSGAPRRSWPLYEVFVRGKRGLNHVHVGSLRAADDDMALLHARDLYTRRRNDRQRERTRSWAQPSRVTLSRIALTS